MRITTQTSYEWDLESFDDYGDIVDHDWYDKFPGIPEMQNVNLVLIKDVARGISGDPNSFSLDTRAWAYVVNGKLPAEFDDGSPVPQRFHKEMT